MLNLSESVRLTPSSRIALVGAGGKTSAMFQIARDFIGDTKQQHRSILLSTSTHLAAEQTHLADQHFITEKKKDLDVFHSHLPAGISLITGPAIHTPDFPDRVSGLSDEMLNELKFLADKHNTPLLIEADGSRLRPIKVPADHEPLIPHFCNTVIVTVGLSCLDKPLNSEWVHRPEEFSVLTGLPMDEQIREAELLHLLLHPLGGQKNIPKNARRIVLFSQATDAVLQARGYKMSKSLLPHYHAVIIAGLAWDQLFQKKRDFRCVFAVHEPVCAIILAAGGSSRFGSPKPLLTWHEKTFIEQVLQTAQQSYCSPVIIVAGDAISQIETRVSHEDVNIIYNPDWREGQSTSIHTGLKATPSACGAAIFLLVDQPQVECTILSSLIESHASSLAPIIAPQVDGNRANPVLFDRSTFHQLLQIGGDQGGRVIFSKNFVQWLYWMDPRLLFDIDTPQDYQRILNSE